MPKPEPPPDESLMAAVVAVPGVVDAIDRQTEVLKGMGTSTPPTIDLTALIDAINGNTSAIRDHAESIDENTEALMLLIEQMKPEPPTPATSISLTIEREPLKEKDMPLQLYPDKEGFKATFLFNGTIDEEPACVVQGPFCAMTQDPKVERPAADNPNNKETLVTVHVTATSPTALGTIDLSTTAKVDNPSTQEVETITQLFEAVAEWIAPSAAKATSVSMQGLEAEPLP